MMKGALSIFIKFTGKYLRQSLFFNKVAGLFFTEHLWWLLLIGLLFKVLSSIQTYSDLGVIGN